MDNEFKDIIGSLKQLKPVTHAPSLYHKVITLWVPSLPTKSGYPDIPLFPFRAALILLFLTVLSGTGVVIASQNSQPGQLLYPVKQIVESVKTQLQMTPDIDPSRLPPSQPTVSATPSADPSTRPQPTPTPSTIVPRSQESPPTILALPTSVLTPSPSAPQPNPSPEIEVQVLGVQLGLDMTTQTSPEPSASPLIELPIVELGGGNEDDPILRIGL